jgi:hypothetical protein
MIDLQRLRDRKLVQLALAYLAGAWLVLQLIDLLGDTFSWPQLVPRIAAVLLGIGFFAMVVLAWYHGEKGSQRVGGVELLMLAGILVIAGVAVGFFARNSLPDKASGGGDVAAAAAVGESAEQGSIAVPFGTEAARAASFSTDSPRALTVPAQTGAEVAARRRHSSSRRRSIDSISRALRVAHAQGQCGNRQPGAQYGELIDAKTIHLEPII